MDAHDRNLLQRTRRGEDQAARELWSRFAPRMHAYARTILGTRVSDAADDVVQGVFVSILAMPRRRIGEVDDVASWMLRLTRNAALNHLRSVRRERARTAAAGELRNGRSFEPKEAAVDGVMMALESLPRRHREPLVLRHIAGLTFDQLALAMSLNRSTAASRYRTALALLRQTLGVIPATEPAGESHA